MTDATKALEPTIQSLMTWWQQFGSTAGADSDAEA